MGQDQLIRGHIAAAEGRDGCEVAADGGVAAVTDDVYNDIRGFFLPLPFPPSLTEPHTPRLQILLALKSRSSTACPSRLPLYIILSRRSRAARQCVRRIQ